MSLPFKDAAKPRVTYCWLGDCYPLTSFATKGNLGQSERVFQSLQGRIDLEGETEGANCLHCLILPC